MGIAGTRGNKVDGRADGDDGIAIAFSGAEIHTDSSDLMKGISAGLHDKFS